MLQLMKKLLIATHNKGKAEELRNFLSDLPVELVSLTDVGITEDVVEDGATYKANSLKKAVFYAKKSGLPAIADDGGLEIAALNGEPGVKSRRWLGRVATDQELADHLGKVARSLPDANRKAMFRLVLTLALPDGKNYSADASVEGIIAKEPLGVPLSGLPYRIYFFLPEINKYYHEQDLPPLEMKRYNHRYKALQKLKPLIAQHVLKN